MTTQRKYLLVLFAAAAGAAGALAIGHRAHLAGLLPFLTGLLPFLILLACPLLHVFMHGDHGGHAGHGAEAPVRPSDPKE